MQSTYCGRITSAAVTALPLIGLTLIPWQWDGMSIYLKKTLFHHCCIALSGISFLSLASAVWQSVSTSAAASMIEIATHAYARAEIGLVAQALSWGVFMSQVLAASGLLLVLVAKDYI